MPVANRQRCPLPPPPARLIAKQQSSVTADISALLDCAAAEVVPHFEEPKKMWPQPFETAGGSYVFASEFGLYCDPDSMFYYDAHSKVYHNAFTGAYYRCVDSGSSGAAAFQAFVPPLPVDAAPYAAPAATKPTEPAKPALSLSLKKDKKKAPGISFGNLKATAFASASSLFEQGGHVQARGGGPAAPAASGVAVASVGIKRKSAEDIAKWSQRQREAKDAEREGSSATPARATPPAHESTRVAAISASSTAANAVIDALTNVQEVPICLVRWSRGCCRLGACVRLTMWCWLWQLCRRKFGSLQMLRKHEKLSKLHLANVAKAKENKQHIAAQCREHEKEMERDAKKQRQEEQAPPASAPGSNRWAGPALVSKPDPGPTASSLESGIGGKMLKMMGWKSGEGLGKHGTGITAPIKAAGQAGRSDTAGLGLKAPLSASVDLSDVTSDKERRQRLARARYDADNA
jgi:RNA-binding protein 5/10